MMAGGYIAAWLIASQLLLSEIVRRAPDTYQHFKQQTKSRRRQKNLIDDLENPDESQRIGAINSAVASMLSRFSEKLSTSVPPSQADVRQKNLDILFNDENYAVMHQAGVNMVKGAIRPKKTSGFLRNLFADKDRLPPSAKAATQPSPLLDPVDSGFGVSHGTKTLSAQRSVNGHDPAP